MVHVGSQEVSLGDGRATTVLNASSFYIAISISARVVIVTVVVIQEINRATRVFDGTERFCIMRGPSH